MGKPPKRQDILEFSVRHFDYPVTVGDKGAERLATGQMRAPVVVRPEAIHGDRHVGKWVATRGNDAYAPDCGRPEGERHAHIHVLDNHLVASGEADRRGYAVARDDRPAELARPYRCQRRRFEIEVHGILFVKAWPARAKPVRLQNKLQAVRGGL